MKIYNPKVNMFSVFLLNVCFVDKTNVSETFLLPIKDICFY